MIRLADVMEVAQISILNLDRGARSYESIAPRRDPVMDGSDQTALRVTVAPLRAKGHVPELPWLGLKIAVALVIVADSVREKELH
ncbi:MAG TPA: hypothetical protein VME69_10280 [Methylocella sp.]|nr:hypothetical protein [Methylocella sp.]